MGHGLRRGVPVTAVMIESAGPTHERLAMSAEQAAPVVNVLVGAHRPLVRRGLRDLTWGGHLGQERRRDEFDRSTVLLLYLGPGGLSGPAAELDFQRDQLARQRRPPRPVLKELLDGMRKPPTGTGPGAVYAMRSRQAAVRRR